MSNQQVLFESMCTSFEMNSKCVIGEGSDVAFKFSVVSEEIAKLHGLIAYYEKQIFPLTADGDYLKKHGEVKGIFKKNAAKSTGQVLFKANSPAASPIVIPIGTLVTSSIAIESIYQTTAEVTMPAGSSSIAAPIESVESGKNTVIAPSYVDVLVTPIAGISSVINSTKISGGSDGESDELYRQRVCDSYSKVTNGANLNYYEQLAKTVSDVWYAKAVYVSGSSNQIIVYVQNFSRTISDLTITEVQDMVTSAREVGINVIVMRPTAKILPVILTVKVANLSNSNTYRSQLEVIVLDYINALGVGEEFSPSLLSAKLLQHPGALDINVSSSAVVLASNEIAQCGNVTISFRI